MIAYQDLLDQIMELPIVDTHEHLPEQPKWRRTPCDLFTEFLSHYFDKDLISAGMPKQALAYALDIRVPIKKRWEALAPWWEACRRTGYGQSLDLSAKGVYGFDRIDGDTVEDLNQAFLEGVKDPDHFRHVLRDLCRIERSINDGFGQWTGRDWSDDSLYFQVKRLDLYLRQPDENLIKGIGERSGMLIEDFDSYLEAVRRDILSAAENGYSGFKLGCAYERPLKFDRTKKEEAASLFHEALAAMRRGSCAPRPIALQDYMLHFCLSILNDMGAFLQIHTGYQEGNGNTLKNSDPLLLNDLFAQYADIKFDLFHTGFPFCHEAGSLAKMYPNVNIDLCWMNIISPVLASRILFEYLDYIPANKIFAFGGDYLFVDGVYGHQMLARQNVARALFRRVERGLSDAEDAMNLAKMVLRDNPLNRLGLKI